jgi:hypothetical protein
MHAAGVVGVEEVVSIPQSGFLVVTQLMLAATTEVCLVSIPQSGFLVVTLRSRSHSDIRGRVSIPQSGFLVVTPHGASRYSMKGERFQSLSRDSWWSHYQDAYRSWHQDESFNPSVGILGGHTIEFAPHTLALFSFNPSVGILGGHTTALVVHVEGFCKFQSLSRDSWWSHPLWWPHLL